MSGRRGAPHLHSGMGRAALPATTSSVLSRKATGTLQRPRAHREGLPVGQRMADSTDERGEEGPVSSVEESQLSRVRCKSDGGWVEPPSGHRTPALVRFQRVLTWLGRHVPTRRLAGVGGTSAPALQDDSGSLGGGSATIREGIAAWRGLRPAAARDRRPEGPYGKGEA